MTIGIELNYNGTIFGLPILGFVFFFGIFLMAGRLSYLSFKSDQLTLKNYAERLRQKELAKKRKPKAQQIYNDEFLAIRTDVLKRDNYTCVNCGQTGTELHVHHIVARAEGGTNDLTNLVTLCASCHSVQDAKGHELIGDCEKIGGYKKMPKCHICGKENEGSFQCAQCNEPTCQDCGDGSICNSCLDEDVFLFGVLEE